MSRRHLYIAPIAWPPEGQYDGLFVTLGYEERARYVAEAGLVNAGRLVAWAFESRQELSFNANESWLRSNGFELVPESTGGPQEWLHSVAGTGSGTVRLAIDISSMTRARIALWVEALMCSDKDVDLEVDFWYAMARFSPPVPDNAPNIAVGPVLSSFAGWSTDPGAPTVLVLGLGYEQDQAIGAVEYIEPAAVFAYEPSGTDAEYNSAVAAANEQLWGMRPRPPRRILYKPERLFDTFVSLDGLLGGLTRRWRPILLPFGPKAFSLIALLAAQFHRTVAVWRVSAGAAGTAVQRIASGEIVGLRAKFARGDQIDSI